ncbi:MAG: hypothetical protein H6712_08465 [Myxococcales bacterium]|nr:hypothetical protein [Myxococcales bacterium]
MLVWAGLGTSGQLSMPRGMPSPSTSGSPESDEPESDEPESDEPESDEPESDEPESDEPESDEPEVVPGPVEPEVVLEVVPESVALEVVPEPVAPESVVPGSVVPEDGSDVLLVVLVPPGGRGSHAPFPPSTKPSAIPRRGRERRDLRAARGGIIDCYTS